MTRRADRAYDGKRWALLRRPRRARSRRGYECCRRFPLSEPTPPAPVHPAADRRRHRPAARRDHLRPGHRRSIRSTAHLARDRGRGGQAADGGLFARKPRAPDGLVHARRRLRRAPAPRPGRLLVPQPGRPSRGGAGFRRRGSSCSPPSRRSSRRWPGRRLSELDDMTGELRGLLAQARAQQASQPGGGRPAAGPRGLPPAVRPGVRAVRRPWTRRRWRPCWAPAPMQLKKDLEQAFSRLPRRGAQAGATADPPSHPGCPGAAQRRSRRWASRPPRAPQLAELMALLFAGKAETGFAPAELWADILLPLGHIGAPRQLPRPGPGGRRRLHPRGRAAADLRRHRPLPAPGRRRGWPAGHLRRRPGGDAGPLLRGRRRAAGAAAGARGPAPAVVRPSTPPTLRRRSNGSRPTARPPPAPPSRAPPARPSEPSLLDVSLALLDNAVSLMKRSTSRA